jgi:long-chain acyl-CoA synthetase
MSFLENIFRRLESASAQKLLVELRDRGPASVSGGELAELIAQARTFLRRRGLKTGDRCVLLAANSIRWVAIDLAIIAEGLIVVPLYRRQAKAELVGMMKDCSPALICCDDVMLAHEIAESWPGAPPRCLLEEVFSTGADALSKPELDSARVIAILYTSGTSGEAKGVMLTAVNVGHILGSTSAQLDILMNHRPGQDRIYQWAPLNFAAAWITLLTSLARGSLIFLNTDLARLAQEVPEVSPDYFVNVPALLERVRRGVDERIRSRGGPVSAVYERAKTAYLGKHEADRGLADWMWLAVARAFLFPALRKKLFGGNLKALVSGSAPLALETQLYFMMLEVPVLQVYGLTETTGICTLDDPRRVEPGRVGRAIPGTTMELGEHQEILVRGPHVFPGYWNRAGETSKVLRGGWFHTGDQGEVDPTGNWKILGRLKNLIILNSGHNIAPEPIETALASLIPGLHQVVLIGNGRSYLTVILTGQLSAEDARAALERLNSRLPHYKQLRAFHIHSEPFTVENGLLTANGKLKRDLISERLKSEIDEMYAAKHPSLA